MSMSVANYDCKVKVYASGPVRRLVSATWTAKVNMSQTSILTRFCNAMYRKHHASTQNRDFSDSLQELVLTICQFLHV